MALLAFRDRRPRALRLALRVLSITFVVLKSSRGNRLSLLASSNINSRTSAASRASRSRCSSSSPLSLKVRWARLPFRPLVALVARLHMLETLLTLVRQSPKPNK